MRGPGASPTSPRIHRFFRRRKRVQTVPSRAPVYRRLFPKDLSDLGAERSASWCSRPVGPPNARLSFIRLRGRRSSAELASLGLCDSRGVERSRGTGVPAVRRAVRLRDSPERSLLGPPLIEGSKSFGPKIHWFTIRVFTRHVTRSSTLFKKCSKTGCRGIYSVCPCTSSRTNAS